jgi:single-strand DNA-binding protein
MNKVVLLGRLTKEPDARYTNTGKAVTSITLAVNRPYKTKDGKQEADFIPVVIWDKAAELVGNSTKKGHRLLVEGRINTRNYDNKEGNKVYVTEVIADRVEFIEKKEQPTKKADFKEIGEEVPFE